MAPEVALLKEFSRGFVRGKAKIETEQFGFAYLEQLLSGGATLEYGELTDTRLLHKYKIIDVPDCRMDELLQSHIMKECNVCRYFGADENDALCFNMDNNYKTNNTVIIPELSLALDALRKCLQDPRMRAPDHHQRGGITCGCESKNRWKTSCSMTSCFTPRPAPSCRFKPAATITMPSSSASILTSKSMTWCRCAYSVPNTPRTKYSVMCGHQRALSGQAASWKYFEHFMRNKTVSAAKFRAALDKLLSAACASARMDFRGDPAGASLRMSPRIANSAGEADRGGWFDWRRQIRRFLDRTDSTVLAASTVFKIAF